MYLSHLDAFFGILIIRSCSASDIIRLIIVPLQEHNSLKGTNYALLSNIGSPGDVWIIYPVMA